MSAPVRQSLEVAAGPEQSFTAGKFVIIDIGRHSVGIIRLRNGDLRAVLNLCPHKGAPICRGIVGGTWPPAMPDALRFDQDGEVLVCPWHGFEYDLQDGREMFREKPTRLRFFPVAVRDGTVYVTV
ncbi:MAG: hypothetical protein B7Z78_04200 [Rhodospirillales bacterium 20-60-12]|nr:MAG: hypothetical protein B7Z78_04200 [Rhodospirillales bacterium 20-60-12]HQT67572.1 Rieske (2Fe-2S) protein [Acetobacteraceae bacterium]